MGGRKQVQVWKEQNGVPTMTLAINMSLASYIFATINGDIYFANGDDLKRVDKWTQNATIPVLVTPMNKTCYGLFVDVIDNLYCAFEGPDHVVRRSPNETLSNVVVVAGNGTSGLGPNMLNGPRGIFVDAKLDLYVADCFNGRVQLFPSGQLMGTTVAGSGVPGSSALIWPTDVVLDGNGYLYIVEYNGHRVVASGPNGFRCIIACTGVAGSDANQLSQPYTLSFDSHGNLFVTDSWNSRVQKFVLATNTCGEYNSRDQHESHTCMLLLKFRDIFVTEGTEPGFCEREAVAHCMCLFLVDPMVRSWTDPLEE